MAKPNLYSKFMDPRNWEKKGKDDSDEKSRENILPYIKPEPGPVPGPEPIEPVKPKRRTTRTKKTED